jgi:2-methylisocitrate lyase-like PEP mutase family enzyme
MANNLEGGGKTPLLRPEALAGLGFKLVAYPLSLLGVSVRAMEAALADITAGGVPPPGAMPSFKVRGTRRCYRSAHRWNM